MLSNLLGRKARLKGDGGRGPNSHYTHEIVAVYLEDSRPCVTLLGRDGCLYNHLAVNIQVRIEN